MKITKTQLRQIIREIINETKADGYEDPAYRATIKQFKGKKVSKKEFAQALAMHHDSMKEELISEQADLRSMYYDLGDKIGSFEWMIDRFNPIKGDGTIKQIYKQMSNLHNKLYKHLNKNYPGWD